MGEASGEPNAAGGIKEHNLKNQMYALCWAYATDAIFTADVETGLLVDANPAAEALTGYSHGELVGLDQSLLHPAAEREAIRNAFRDAASKPTIVGGYHVQRKDGSQVPVEISSSQSFWVDHRLLVVGTFRDVSAHEEFNRRLLAHHWALTAYASAATAFGRCDSAEELMQAVCNAITQEPRYVLAWVGIAENAPGKPVRVAACAGPARAYLDQMAMSWSEGEAIGQGPTGVAIRSGAVQIMKEAETSAIFKPWQEQARQIGIRSEVSIPFVTAGDMRGALVVAADHLEAFEGTAVRVLERLTEEFSHGLDALEQRELLVTERLRRERTQKQLRTALFAAVGAVAAAMEQRDPYTAGHESRVARIAGAIGRDLGWSEDRLQGLETAALIHDIGKISVPSEILTKPSRIRAPERALIDEHPETGYDILKDVPFAWPIADMVRQHHERIDGSGYPQGLKGDSILPEAKVLAVADVVEAMSSFRPYRPALGVDFALGEIEKQAGIAFDAEIVRTCLRLFRDKHFQLPAASGPSLERGGGLELER